MRALAAVMVSAVIAAAQFAGSAASRLDTNLNANWKFVLQEVPGGEEPAFDDSGWSRVDLPHCWNIDAGQDGNSRAFYNGAGWYRRHLAIPTADASKRSYLRFEGAFVVTDVYVNGILAGRHDGGFAAFCFDVTGLVKPGRDNVVAVRVQGSPSAHDGPPQGGDYTKFGGLYRGVHLLTLSPVAISPIISASPGVFLKETEVSRESAHVDATVMASNSTAGTVRPVVRISIFDSNGKLAATASEEVPVQPGETAPVTLPMRINHPHLWNGTADPYLYRAVADVLQDGKVVDSVEQPLGLRFFRVDAATGFSLNGRPYALHGVNRHQDRLDKGWAISPSDMTQDVDLISKMGATCLRTAHYQQADHLYSLCDRQGIVVWTELCMVNSVRRTAAFRNNAMQQLVELIKQNYNHPSICFWSLWNEITFEGGKKPSQDDLAFLSSLNDMAKRLDPTRLTTGANNSLNNQRDSAPITDIIAWNVYPGWYGGKPGDLTKMFADLASAFPGRALGISEYGAGASVYHHEAAPAQPASGGPFHPEEWQSTVHEADWKTLNAHHELWGTYLWNMFDFASITRKEGDHPGRNDKGLVTYDRNVCKDAFYFYQAQWTKRLMVHITSERFTPRPAGATTLKVYSNADKVELWLGGRSLGSKTSDSGVFVWEVALPAGTVRIEAVATRGSERLADGATVVCSVTAPARLGPPDPPKKPAAPK